MIDRYEMTLIITIIILVIGLVAVLQVVHRLGIKSYYAYRNRRLIDLVVVLMYLLGCFFTELMYFSAGFDLNVIYGVLVVLVCLLLVFFFVSCSRDREHMHRGYMIAFLIYFGAVLYLTILMRIGSMDTSIITTAFDDLFEAVTTRDAALVNHMMSNIILFIPFGILIPLMNPYRFHSWSFVFLGGLMTSTVIEGIQMICRLGQADVDDIIANVMGALLGYLCLLFIQQVRRNWTL